MKRLANFSILILMTLMVSCGVVEPEDMNGSLMDDQLAPTSAESNHPGEGMAKQVDNPEQLDAHPVFALPIKPTITK